MDDSDTDQPLYFQFDVDATASTMRKLVVSPLATMRFRLGHMIMTSPVSFKTVFIDESLLPLLAFLKTPRTERECLESGLQIGLEGPKLLAVIHLLKDRRIIEEVTAPADDSGASTKQSGTSVTQAEWWDKKDAGHFDIRMHQIVQVLYGNSNTLLADFPLNADNEPIPWFSYPATEFLETLDLSAARIFEYGSGGSTIYLEKRCKEIVSVEQDKKWLSRIKEMSSGKTDFKLRTTVKSFSNAILEEEGKYDLVIIDAIPEFRSACVVNSVEKLADEGIIILDDSAIYREAYGALKKIDECPIDFIGLSPMEDVVQTTTFFFNRKGSSPTIRKRIPSPKGSPGYQWNI